MADHALATLTNPTAALTDFTLIVDLSTMPASWWSAVTSTDGTKGRVYKGDGTTRLAADWIDFDSVASTGLLRVLWSGTLATTGTQQLWIEPPVTGNAAVLASDTYGSDNAYDANWEGYWPDGGASDRTANNFNLSAAGGVTAGGVTGKIGRATDYDGSTQYHSGVAPVTAVPLTMMGWLNPDTDGDSEILANLADDTTYNQQFSLYRRGTGSAIAAITLAGGALAQAKTSTTLGSGVWGHGVAVFSTTASRTAYLNAAGAVTDTNTAAPTGINTFGIGASQDTTRVYANAQIGEVQLHSAVRSADWVSSEYDQTNDQATFWGTWTWETTGGITISAACVDGISFTDSTARNAIFSASCQDGLALSDSDLNTAQLLAQSADGVQFTDNIAAIATLLARVYDGVTVSDSVTATLSNVALCADGISLSDSNTAQAQFTGSVSDGVKLSEAISATLQAVALADDGIVLSDSTTWGAIIQALAADGIKLTDTTARTLQIFAQAADGITLSDTGQATATFNVECEDGAQFADSLAAVMNLVAAVYDGATFTDTPLEVSTEIQGRVTVTFSMRTTTVTFNLRKPDVDISMK